MNPAAANLLGHFQPFREIEVTQRTAEPKLYLWATAAPTAYHELPPMNRTRSTLSFALAFSFAFGVAACADRPAASEAGHSATHSTEESPEMSESESPARSEQPIPEQPTPAQDTAPTTEIATLGAGCFWCIEAVLEQVEGVVDVSSGYMGGEVENPTYEQVCSGTSGHVEVARVSFDPAVISYEAVLEWFWNLHDPTTLNRQGNDAGTQYRSAIFYHSEEQRETAFQSKQRKDASGAFADPIVTEITPASTYYAAEGYHQDYYRLNSEQGYCRFVIAPKLDKLGLKK